MTDAEQDAARMLRELQESLKNLADRQQSTEAPQVLRSVTETAADADDVDVDVSPLEDGKWNTTNYGTSAWGQYD